MKIGRKNYILFSIIFLMMILSWKLSIYPTIELSKEIELLESELALAKNSPSQILKLEKDLLAYQNSSSSVVVSLSSLRKSLLQRITKLTGKHEVNLRSFPQSSTSYLEGIEISTSVVELEGNFINLLQLADEIENDKGLGKLASIKFKSVEDRRTKRRSLLMTLYIQSINS